ncbi:MAG: NACHT domain-containing protein, partial [Desulfobacteraceae bacterium]
MADEQDVVVDQKNQTVKNQTNVAGDVNVSGPYIAGDHIAEKQGPDPLALQRSYLSSLTRKTRYLPLDCVDPKAVTDEACKELQLSAVYTALMTDTPEKPRGDITLKKQAEEEIRYLSALEMLNKEEHLVLLGDPGSGKSTFVNFVATCLAGEILKDNDANIAALTAPIVNEEDDDEKEKAPPQPWDLGQILPVRVVLRDLAARGLPEPEATVADDTLWKFMLSELGDTLKKDYGPHLKKTLWEKGGLILLDGLDEVPDAKERRLQVKQAVQGFAALFPNCRMLVTSRTYAYQRQDWQLTGFTTSVLSPFTFSQIQQFIHNWYENTA